MDYLITGANGQLGKELQDKLKAKGASFIGVGQDLLNITDTDNIDKVFKEYNPKVVINTAAYTAVDKAEEEKELCYKVNCEGVKNLAIASQKFNAKLIHISTDYIFDGTKGEPIKEDDETNPLNVYGATKLEGEKALKEILQEEYLLVRTSSVHGQYGNNFVKTMIKLLTEKDTLKVVNDQFMCATYAGFLADIILELESKDAKGTFHVANSGIVSWYEFTLKIREFLAATNDKVKNVTINPCNSLEFPRPAKRPKFSAFNLNKIESFLNREMMTWQDGLISHLKDLNYMVM